MANWQFRLEFGDFWHDDDIPLYVKAEIVATRCKALLPDIRSRRQSIYLEMATELERNIIPFFEELAEEESDSVEDFDDALNDLYDWADTPLDDRWAGKKMCWVNTFRH